MIRLRYGAELTPSGRITMRRTNGSVLSECFLVSNAVIFVWAPWPWECTAAGGMTWEFPELSIRRDCNAPTCCLYIISY
ncbi:uncharacterized protein LAESUDRAFT_731829, partial [Laetiporus sulphureus 93-53]